MNYNTLYQQPNVWGAEPSPLLKNILDKLPPHTSFLDLGCGQGRDTIFMSQKGFPVTAVDNSATGIEQIREKIKDNPHTDLICDDIGNFKINKNEFGIINLINVLQFLKKENALKIIEETKQNIQLQGYILIAGFTTQDNFFIMPRNKNKCFFATQELKNLFSDFKIIFYEEKNINDPGHPGSPIPHTHSTVRLIAQKQ